MAIALSLCIINFLFYVVCEFECAQYAQNQLAQTSLSQVLSLLLEMISQYFDLIVNFVNY